MPGELSSVCLFFREIVTFDGSCCDKQQDESSNCIDMNLKLSLIACGTVFFSSCSFNSIFLQPQKIPANVRKLTVKSEADTMRIEFSGDGLQPVFYNVKGDTLKFNYKIEGVCFKGRTGHTLNGWMISPLSEKPVGTILHLHGNAGCVLSQYQAMTPLVERGFQAFVWDYSGFGFSEGDATRSQIINDANDALTYLKSRSDVQGLPFLIYGQSLGGHLSAVVAAQRESEIDALVIEGAFSSHKDIAASRIPLLGRILVKEGYSAMKSIVNFHKPVLVIHSTEDEVIPVRFGRKIMEAANEPKQYFEIKKCHICGTQFYADEITSKIKSMILK